MKITPFLSLVALIRAPGALAQPKPTKTSAEATTTTTTSSPSCTASKITTLCDYPEPEDYQFAIVADSRSFCWDLCNARQPCDFVIFVEGNPYTGSGNCWLYPGEKYDKSKGTTDCGPDGGSPYLEVFDKPTCKDDKSATTTSEYSCKATASPSAVASEICDYPPPEDCFHDCVATQNGASECLSYCAEDYDCKYVVFNPASLASPDEQTSEYGTGTCWKYVDGKYDEKKAKTCKKGAVDKQWVYENNCPKPPKPTTSTSQASSTTGTDGAEAASSTSSDDSAPTGLARNGLLAMGMAALIL